MVSAEESARRIDAILRNNLRQLPKDENEKTLNNLWKFVGDAISNDYSQKQICAEAAKLINRTLPFAEISLALRVPGTRTFRYEAVVGFRQEVEKELRNRTYTEEEAINSDREPHIRLDNFIDFELAEGTSHVDHTFEQLEYNRPTRLLEERKALDEMKEGDYIVVFFRGIRGELLGYVELESPRNRKLPQGNVLKWLEIFGMIIGILLQSADVHGQHSAPVAVKS